MQLIALFVGCALVSIVTGSVTAAALAMLMEEVSKLKAKRKGVQL